MGMNDMNTLSNDHQAVWNLMKEGIAGLQSNHKITCMLDRFPLTMILSGYLFNSLQGNPQGIPPNSGISVLLSILHL